eukprot:CAMPEP_0197450512 /NCGR_PEP_ID=MMETSP1175-20131217/25606_1 /TAXON_ID=1003142 /ORGANISM="Triceratium dubium, Strain CCMP147" /LENGTH=62 /DNA_ID=CAMNT_0042982951 /DNA_START=17 /DNA_END=202 /DNA_ORIENTATION=+
MNLRRLAVILAILEVVPLLAKNQKSHGPHNDKMAKACKDKCGKKLKWKKCKDKIEKKDKCKV